MGMIFQKKVKNILKKGKSFENFGKMYKILKYFENGQVTACDNRT